MAKRLLMLFILVAGYIWLVMATQAPVLKNPLYRCLLDIYGKFTASRAEIKILYNPGLRAGVLSPAEVASLKRQPPAVLSWEELLAKPGPNHNRVKMAVIEPEAPARNQALLDGVVRHQARLLVQCSRMDTWFTFPEGRESLARLRGQCLRAVVFDGGHHLPTLGLYPDIIIVPVTGGYAAHAYMADGMEISRLEALLREAGSPAVLVTVPRWALVKSKACLGTVAARVVKQLLAAECWQRAIPEKPVVIPRLSKFRGNVYGYIDTNATRQCRFLPGRLAALGLDDVRNIYLAFDYRHTDRGEAVACARRLQKSVHRPIKVVNQPVTVAGALWVGWENRIMDR